MPGQLASVGADDRHLLWECPLLGGLECLLVRMLTWFWCHGRSKRSAGAGKITGLDLAGRIMVMELG